jgi:hypothetical protein
MRTRRYYPPAPASLGAFVPNVAERFVEVVDTAKAWVVIQALQQGYVLAEQLVLRLTPQTLTEAFLSSPAGALIYAAIHAGNAKKAEELLSTQKQAALKAVRMNHGRIVSLRTTLFEAAKAGKFPDGRPYSWTQWKGFAKDVADDLRSQVAYQAESAYLLNIAKMLGDMVITVVKVVDAGTDLPTLPPSKWPWWVWASGGLAGLGVLAYATNTFRAFLPSLPGARR